MNSDNPVDDIDVDKQMIYVSIFWNHLNNKYDKLFSIYLKNIYMFFYAFLRLLVVM